MFLLDIAKAILGPLAGVAKPLVDVAVDGVQGWVERKKIRTQAKIELEHKRATADVDWDQLQVKASGHSWKDEFWTLVLAIPVVMAFIPALVPYVEQGFRVLETTPDWYKAALGVSIAAAFGVRQLSKAILRKPRSGPAE